MSLLRSFHHVAFRCRDAAETVDFYTAVLGADYCAAIRERLSASMQDMHARHAAEGEPSMEMLHIFFRLQDGSCIAFFDLPELPEQGWDPHTPRWVQHFAFAVDREARDEICRRLRERNIAFTEPKPAPTGSSVYFLDPSGHRVELKVVEVADPASYNQGKDPREFLARWNEETARFRMREAATAPVDV